MQSLHSLLVALTYPPALTAALLVAAALLALTRWRRLALATAVLAIAWSWLSRLRFKRSTYLGGLTPLSTYSATISRASGSLVAF